ncbi:MAG TPA: hypothetical protein VFN90_02680 [Gemmatimonadales bacterium]|nr:hypothetical protein [Gemmatimonadales bacterium]
MRNAVRLSFACLAIALAACDDNILPPAAFENQVDTVTLASLVGTPVGAPSAFSIPDGQPVRTDISAAFDFAYLATDGRRLVLPIDATGLRSGGTSAGVQKSTQAFEAIGNPPTQGYLTTDSIGVAVGDVLIGRSRVACFLGVPQYARLRVLSFDDAARTMTFEVVANINCGYRSLALGLPEE